MSGAQGVAGRASPLGGTGQRWWLSIGSEAAAVSEACPVHGCTATISSVDVYCANPQHGDLLLFQGWPTGRRRWAILNLVRTVLPALVVWGASIESPWPIYTVAVAVGVALIWLPLHAHRLARAMGIAGWLIIALATAGAAFAGDDVLRAMHTVAVALPVAGLLVLGLLTVLDRTRSRPRGARHEAQRAVALAGISAVAACLAWLLTLLITDDQFVPPPATVSRWLGFSVLTTVLGALVSAGIGAFLLSLERMDRSVQPLLDLPGNRCVAWQYTVQLEAVLQQGRFGERLVVKLHNLRERLRASLVRACRRTANGLFAIVGTAQRLGYRLANWVHRHAVLLARRLVFLIVHGCRIAAAGATTALRAIAYTTRPIAAYVGVLVGVLAARHLAHDFLRYLVDGPIAGLAAGACWSLVGIIACGLVAERLASESTRTVVQAEIRMLGNAGPDLVLWVIASGWVVGIPGLLGYGPIRVGWVTGVGTVAVLVAALGPSRRGTRARNAAANSDDVLPAGGTPTVDAASDQGGLAGAAIAPPVASGATSPAPVAPGTAIDSGSGDPPDPADRATAAATTLTDDSPARSFTSPGVRIASGQHPTQSPAPVPDDAGGDGSTGPGDPDLKSPAPATPGPDAGPALAPGVRRRDRTADDGARPASPATPASSEPSAPGVRRRRT